MEGDFRRPARGPDGFSAGRPRPQPSHRPHLTDPRPQVQAAQPALKPAQPAQHHQPARPQPAPHHEAPAKPTTAELIARHERESKQSKGSRRGLYRAAAGLLVIIIAAAVLAVHHSAKQPAGPFPASISPTQVTIPVYYPKDLPAGFRVGGSKVVKQDVLSYDVTSPANYNYYVNIQPVPAGYNFTAFNKRFTSPASYQTPIGTATAGLMNNQLICSIDTGKSWVLINSAAVKSMQDMVTISKALKPASL